MNVEKNDLHRYGQFLSTIHLWFRDAFNQLLNALYGDEETEEKRCLETPAVMFLENGVLHPTTDGAERFRLQAFLQLDDISSPPRLIWELAGRPNLKGKKPELALSTWNELPHNAPDESWGNQEQEEALSIHSCKDEQCRYLVIYHSPTNGIHLGIGY